MAAIAISLGTALAAIDGTIANIALPTIARDMQVSSAPTVLVVTVYQLVLVMTLLPFSALGDRIGYARLYFFGQLLFLCASLLVFFVANLPALLVMRAIQACGASASLSMSVALIRSTYPKAQLGRGLALNTIIITSSNAFAPTLGGIILGISSWKMVFVAAAPLALLSMLAGVWSFPKMERLKVKYDYTGAALCASGLGLSVSGLEAFVHGVGLLAAGGMVTIGVAILTVFVRRDLLASAPLLPLDLMRKPVLALSSISSFIAFISVSSFMVSFPFKLHDAYGFSPAIIGTILAAWPVAMIVVAPTAGFLSDRVSAGLLGGIGMAIAAAAFALIANVPANPLPFDLMWRMALCGSGFGLFFTPNVRLIVGSVPQQRVASIGGFISLTRLTGQTLGATLAATILGYHMGSGQTPALIGCGLAVLAGLLSFVRLAPQIAETGRIAT